jgi:hypothetical protein
MGLLHTAEPTSQVKIFTNVLAGSQNLWTFDIPFSNDIDQELGDYHHDIRILLTSDEDLQQGELGYTLIRSRTRIIVIPDYPCAFISVEVTSGAATGSTVVVTAGDQSGSVVSPAGAQVVVTFDMEYDFATDYISGAGGYLTADEDTIVSIKKVQSATGLTLTPAASALGQSVTIQWFTKRKTQ